MAADDSAEESDEGDEEEEEESESEMAAGESEPKFTPEDFVALQTENESLKSENEQLKQFKADVEKAKKDERISLLFKTVEKVIPEDEMTKLREESKNFTIDNLTEFENKVRAMAFDFTQKGGEAPTNEDENVDFVRADLLQNKPAQSNGSVWH